MAKAVCTRPLTSGFFLARMFVLRSRVKRDGVGLLVDIRRATIKRIKTSRTGSPLGNGSINSPR